MMLSWVGTARSHLGSAPRIIGAGGTSLRRGPGIVLLDTYVPQDVAPRLFDSLAYELHRRSEYSTFDDAGIAAAGHYLNMSHDWFPQDASAPTLVLRPTEGISGMPGNPLTAAEWQTEWPREHVKTTVPGDHFTMNVDHAEETAAAVRDWISECLA